MIVRHRYPQMEVSAFQKTKAGESCCGDSYFVTETEDYFLCALADGLGSGTAANEASDRAVSVIRESHHEEVGTLMRACNRELRASRGAVLSIFKILFGARKLIFSGVGNVRFVFYPPREKSVFPVPAVGFLSGRPLVPRVQTFSFQEGTSFMIHSDGLAMNTASRAAFSDRTSPEEASSKVRQMAEEQDLHDDATFLFGRNNTAMR
ncbi:MAG TPA: PP2C family serine/threonine-protein phosphatase [Bacillales bacterium]|nr:PP2C family serine/threonine-protein phosphatase [Bacillales bacterium]